MIVAIAILGMVAGLVLIKQPWHNSTLNTDATIRTLVNSLRAARSRAIAQDRVVAVVTVPGGFSVDGNPLWLLPPRQTLTAVRIAFLPDGGSTGGSLVLTAEQRRVAIEVNWMTGRVSVMEPKSD